MSSATVTPSLVTLGDPQPLSSTAFRPRGPSVLLDGSRQLTDAGQQWPAGVVVENDLLCHDVFLLWFASNVWGGMYRWQQTPNERALTASRVPMRKDYP